MGTAVATLTPATPPKESVEKTYSYFDAATLESKSEKVTVEFTPPASLAEAMERVGNDQTAIQNAITSYLRRSVLRDAKIAVLSKGVSKKIVLNVLKPFRALPPWSLIEDRGKQTSEILSMLRSNPAIMEAIKAANAAAPADADGDEDDDE